MAKNNFALLFINFMSRPKYVLKILVLNCPFRIFIYSKNLINRNPSLVETSQFLGVCTWFMVCFIFQDAFQAKCDILADNFHRFVHYLAIFVVHRDLCQWRQQYATRCVRLLKDIRLPTIFLPLYKQKKKQTVWCITIYLPHRKKSLQWH